MLTEQQRELARLPCGEPAGTTARIEVYRCRAELLLPLFRVDDDSSMICPGDQSRMWSHRKKHLQHTPAP